MARDGPLPSSFDDDPDFRTDKGIQKFVRRLKEEPLIPLGCLLTVAALVSASRAMRRNDHARANIMFRRRIYAQAFTVAVLVGGSAYYEADRKKRKEIGDLEKERENAVKREKWLAELEARDVEDKAAKEKWDKLKERRRIREEAVKAKADGSKGNPTSKSPDPKELEAAREGTPLEEILSKSERKDLAGQAEAEKSGDKAESLLDKARSIFGGRK